jgi:chemotaxis protein histidine kinase CheA
MIDLSLLPDFIAEAVEHLEEMETNLLQLEAEPGNLEILNDIFRSVHTIKGASEYMGMKKIAELSHKLESLMDMLRRGEKTLNKEIVDALIESRDLINILVSELEQSQTEKTDIGSMIERIDQFLINIPTENATHLSDDVSLMEPGSESESDDADFETAVKKALDDVMEIAPLTEAQADPEDEPDAVLADEIRDDDIGDPELFDIFTTQLNDSFGKIQTHLKELPRSDDMNEILNQCAKIIGTLRSSANYMGYENLTLFYESWMTAIRKAQDESVQMGNPSWSDFIKKYMKSYINKIARLFPQLQKFHIDARWLEKIEAGKDVPDKTKEEVIETVKADDTQPAAETSVAEEIESVIKTADTGEISKEEVIETIKADDTQPAAETSVAEEIESVIETAGTGEISDELKLIADEPNHIGPEEAVMLPLQDEQALFDKLASAYDFYRQDYNPAAGDFKDIIDSNLFSKHDLTLKGRSVAEDFRFSALAVDKIKKSEEAPERPFVSEPQEPLMIDESAQKDTTENQQSEDNRQSTINSQQSEETPFVSEPQEPLTVVKPVQKDTTENQQSEETLFVSEPQEPLAIDESPEKDTNENQQSEDNQQSKEKRYGAVIKKSVRVDANKIDDLMNQVGELVVSRAWFSQLYNEMRELQQYLKESSRLEQKEMKRVRAITFRLSEATVNLGRVATELQEGVMRVRMLPISQLFNRYPRLVRDLIHNTPKKINLEIRGEDTELDKMIIEKISDPLIHIIRNAADHGIETADERQRLGKPETGRIILEAFHESNHVVIEVRDDGQGLNPEKIKAAAVARKFITQDELDVMSAKEVTLLILRPGFSTAAQVTHTSGRGVGMDVVKKNIEKLNGTLEIESEQGVFTQLRIKIPLTLAIISALLVRVGRELYTIPLATVEETLRIEEEATSTIEGNEVIYIRNITLPLVRLSELFDIGVDEHLKGKEFVVIVSTGLKKIGLVVDDLIGQEEVVIKPLEDYLQEKSGFSGATILGDGRVSLILDVSELVNLTIERVTLMRSQKIVYGDFGNHNKAGQAVSEARVAVL